MPIRTRFTSGPLPAAIVIPMVVVARIDDRSRIDHWLGRNDNRLGRNDCWGRSHDRRLGDDCRGRCHDRRLGDHHGIGGDDVMRECDGRRRQANYARREAKPAVMVVVVVVSPRENARRGCKRKSHNKDFLRVHDLPHLSVSAEHHRPT